MTERLTKWILTLAACFSFSLIHGDEFMATVQQAQTPPPLSEIDAELADAHRKFDIAKKMFNPWYAGPLITPSAHNVPPGLFNIQPYLFFTWTYANFNKDRKSVSIPTIFTVNPQFIYQMGLFNWLDFTVTPSGIYNKQSGESTFYWGDTTMTWGIQLMKEQPYKPAVRLTVTETFPTGRYKRLNPKKNGIDATGQGAYVTTFALNLTKVIWWVSDHPFSFRTSLNYGIPTTTHVQGFNAYGGGYGTRGIVRPGNKIAIDTSVELSFTQSWVFALDLVYTYQNHSTFSGHKGRNANGTVASVGSPSNDQLSAAPAIEYNPTEYMGFLAGVWFTIIGRNSSDFVSGVLTMTYYW